MTLFLYVKEKFWANESVLSCTIKKDKGDNMKKFVALLFATLFMLMAMVGCTSEPADNPEDETSEIKAGFVYIGPIGDQGFTHMHDLGRQAVEAEFGIETMYIENVGETSAAKEAIDTLIDAGCNVIFATSFGHMDAMVQASEEHPDLVFAHFSGFKTTENMSNYFGRMYEPRFLSGIAAGHATESNQIGYVAAFAIPEVLRGINAFTLGVQSVNPEAEVNVVWTSDWGDPTIGKNAANGLLDAGCDVIAMHQDSPQPVVAAAEADVYSIGYHAPMAQWGGDKYLTAPIWDVSGYYVNTVQSVIDGTWEMEEYWGGMSDGMVVLDDFGPAVTDEMKADIEAATQAIVSGEMHVFQGPIMNQAGEVVVPEGVTMTDGEMLGMNFLVQGVNGEVSE